MSFRNLIYWEKGFNFSRSTHGDRVAIEAYRLLYHYTWENPNCRAGIFIEKFGEFQKFYTIHQLIPSFDHFYQKAMFQENYIDQSNDFIRDLTGLSFQDEIEKFQRLRSYIRIEFEPKSSLKSLLGYKFKNALCIVINPEEIMQVVGNSLDSFKIQVKGYEIEVAFRTQVSIR